MAWQLRSSRCEATNLLQKFGQKWNYIFRWTYSCTLQVWQISFYLKLIKYYTNLELAQKHSNVKLHIFIFWYWLYVYKIYGNKGQTKATLLVLRCTFVTSTYVKQNNLPQINDRHIEHIEQKSVLILMIKTYGMYLWRNWNSLLLMNLFIKQINIILFKPFVLMWNLPILIFYNQICIFNFKKTALTI